jgi:hypothetical protein
MLLAQTFHHRRAGTVKHDDVKLGEYLLRVQQHDRYLQARYGDFLR